MKLEVIVKLPPKMLWIQGVLFDPRRGWMFHHKETAALAFRQQERWREWARTMPFIARN